MKVGIRFLIVASILVLVLIPTSVFAALQVEPEESITIYATVKDSAGEPVTDATVTLDVYDTDGNLEVDGESMSHVAEGVYKYDFMAPADEGVYFAVADAGVYGHGTMELHVTEAAPGVTAADVWEVEIATYTDSTNFGGIVRDFLGGDMATLIILSIVAVVLSVAAFVIKSGRRILAFAGAGFWTLAGIHSYTMRAATWDIYYGVFWISMGMVFAMVLVAAILRERKEEEPVIYDEVTGERIDGEEEKKEPRKRSSKSRFGKTGRM